MAGHLLDDALAFFLRVDAEDASARRALRERLWQLVLDRGQPGAVRAALADAIAVLDDAHASRPGEESAGLALAQTCLEAAAQAAAEAPVAAGAPVAASAPVTASPSPRAGGTDNIEPTAATEGASAADGPGPMRLPADVDRSLVEDFVAESAEYLGVAEAALLRLEGQPDDAEAINDVFRAFHTIKGTSSFLGLDPIAEFAHHAEGLLDRVRGGELAFVGGVADMALASTDCLGAMVAGLRELLAGRPADLPATRASLLAALSGAPAARAAAKAPRGKRRGGGSRARVPQPEPTPTAPAPPDAINPAASAAARPEAYRGETARNDGGIATGDAFVKVRTDKLDHLVEMVGELVIAQTMLSQDTVVRDAGNHLLAQKVRHADKIVRELQDLTLGLRMVPIRGAVQKLARLVRDVAHRSGKHVVFEPHGEETELDRNLVDLLADPLVHMVRNAVDHGIEPPAERTAAGKPPQGIIRLEAEHAGGSMHIRLSDDGRGLSRERIVRKAIERGLLTTGDGVPDTEVWDLIFAPGFSTAEQVTDISGRGVGMDVVRRNLETMRGRVTIESVQGQGTTFLIQLPLTLAITDGMLVRVGSERFIIPTTRIQQSFRPAASQLATCQGRGELVHHGGNVLPIVRLHRLLGMADASQSPAEALLVVVGEGEQRTAVLVDELLGQQQVVAKSLGAAMGRIPGVAGGAILGDGRVGLVLDVDELLTLTRDGARRAA